MSSRNGKRSTSAATASGHEVPNAGESRNTANVGPEGATDAVANGGDARVASAGCPSGAMASEDDFKTAVLRCRYPVCKTIHWSGWDWDTSRLNEVIADHAGVAPQPPASSGIT